jgi:large subunit ribosomal protein L2
MQFRAPTIGKLKPAKYPVFELAENIEGKIIDLVHEKGRDVPLAKVRFKDGSISFLPAVIGSKIGSKIQFVM